MISVDKNKLQTDGLEIYIVLGGPHNGLDAFLHLVRERGHREGIMTEGTGNI